MSVFDDHSDNQTPAQLFESQIRVTHNNVTESTSKVKEDIDVFRYRDSSDEWSDEALLIKRLTRRLDFMIVPALFLLFCVNFLDRVNIGQAKLEGLLGDINIVRGVIQKPRTINSTQSDHQFQICLTVFYVSYVSAEYFSAKPSYTVQIASEVGACWHSLQPSHSLRYPGTC